MKSKRETTPPKAARFMMFISARGVANLAATFPDQEGNSPASTRTRLYKLLANLGIQEIPSPGGKRAGSGQKRKSERENKKAMNAKTIKEARQLTHMKGENHDNTI